MKRKYLLLFVFVIIIACEQKTDNDKDSVSFEDLLKISNNAAQIADSKIEETYIENTLLDPQYVVQEIELIEEVKSATLSPTGTSIIIELKDGTYTNLILVTRDDERMFMNIELKSTHLYTKKTQDSYQGKIVPNGDGKALILAPFQNSFHSNLSKMSNLLEAAGYSVDIYKNEEATLARFKSSFLTGYDIIYINTHGSGSHSTRGGISSSILLTGEEFSVKKLLTLSDNEQMAIATSTPVKSKKTFFAISVPWLNETVNNTFPNSWIFADACESSKYEVSDKSLSKAFLNLGAVGYSGWDVSVYNSISNLVNVKMITEFSSGISFKIASEKVRDELYYSFWQRLINSDKITQLNSFEDIQVISDPFYLVEPVDNRPIAAFTASPTTVVISESVQFTDQSSNDPSIWSWNFGDGETSSTQNPSHAYSAKGVYTVSLTVMNDYGSDTETKTDYISVKESGSGNGDIIFNPNLTYGDVTDIEGNSYKTIKIGTQTWMAENLKTTKFNNGTSIPLVKDSSVWIGLSTPAYCWYENDISYKNLYGTLYNWYSVCTITNGGKNVCPNGWHVPDEVEWTTLYDYLGGRNKAIFKLKETGTTHWPSPNTGATNESGFTALPSGFRYGYFGSFAGFGGWSEWWSSSDSSSLYYIPPWVDRAFTFFLDSGGLCGISDEVKESGFSIRCVKD